MRTGLRSAEWIVDWRKCWSDFDEVVEQLPWEKRELIRCLLEGLGSSEIAVRMEVNRVTVWRWQSETFKTIRGGMEKKGWRKKDIVSLLNAI